jgi:hypothetical protein
MTKKKTSNKPTQVAPFNVYYVAQLGKAYISNLERRVDDMPEELQEFVAPSQLLLTTTKEFESAMRVANEDDVAKINQFVANAGLPALTWQKVTVNVAAL